jgi:hypothetical protein
MSDNLSTLKDLFNKDEIDLNNFKQLVYKSIFKIRYILISIISISIIVSLIQYYNTNKEYEESVTVLLEQEGGTNSSINGISSLLGISNSNTINQNTELGLIGPDMYNEVIKSQAFLNDVIKTKFKINNKDSITIEEYLSKIKKNNFIFQIFNKKDDKNEKQKFKIDTTSLIQNEITPEIIFNKKIPPIVELTSERTKLLDEFKKRVQIELKEKKCKITVKMPDPLIGALTSKLVLEKLIKYVTLYKTVKIRDNIEYLETRYKEAESNYKKIQSKTANYRDGTLGIILQSAQTREQILNNEMNISFNIYNQFAVQLEQAKIQLKKETPIFTVLEPISINWEKSDPIMIKILITNILKGTLFGIIFLFISLFINFKKK